MAKKGREFNEIYDLTAMRGFWSARSRTAMGQSE